MKKSTQKVSNVAPLSEDEVNNLITALEQSLSISGTPTEAILQCGLLPEKEESRKTFAKKELDVKDAHFKSFSFPFGKTPVFSYTTMDDETVHISAPQLVYLLKNNGAGYKDTLTNEYLKKGGIDYSYEPIGATNTPAQGDNSALRAEFSDLLTALTVPDQSAPDIVKNGRKPDQFRVLVSDAALKSMFPDKFRSKVMSLLAQHMCEFLEFIRDDDDLIIGIVVKRIKD